MRTRRTPPRTILTGDSIVSSELLTRSQARPDNPRRLSCRPTGRTPQGLNLDVCTKSRPRLRCNLELARPAVEANLPSDHAVKARANQFHSFPPMFRLTSQAAALVAVGVILCLAGTTRAELPLGFKAFCDARKCDFTKLLPAIDVEGAIFSRHIDGATSAKCSCVMCKYMSAAVVLRLYNIRSAEVIAEMNAEPYCVERHIGKLLADNCKIDIKYIRDELEREIGPLEQLNAKVRRSLFCLARAISEMATLVKNAIVAKRKALATSVKPLKGRAIVTYKRCLRRNPKPNRVKDLAVSDERTKQQVMMLNLGIEAAKLKFPDQCPTMSQLRDLLCQ